MSKMKDGSQIARVRQLSAGLAELAHDDLKDNWRELAHDEIGPVLLATAVVDDGLRRMRGRGLRDAEISVACELAPGRVLEGVQSDVGHLAAVYATLALQEDVSPQVIVKDDSRANLLAEFLAELFAPIGVEVFHHALADSAGGRGSEYPQTASVHVMSWARAFGRAGGLKPWTLEDQNAKTWAYVYDADIVLLDHAENTIDPVEPRNEGHSGENQYSTVREYFKHLHGVSGSSPVHFADFESHELRIVFDIDVVDAGPVEESTVADEREIGYLNSASRLAAMARVAHRLHDNLDALVAVVETDEVAPLVSTLDEVGVPCQAVVDDSPGSHAVWNSAAQPGAVTVTTRDALVGHSPGGASRASRVCVVASGHSLLSRVDDRIRGLAAESSEPAIVAFYSTRGDQLMRPLDTRFGRWMDRVIFRGARRNKGVALRPDQVQLVSELQERAGRRMMARRAQLRQIPDRTQSA